MGCSQFPGFSIDGNDKEKRNMTDFLLCMVVAMLLEISLGMRAARQESIVKASDKCTKSISILVTSFLVAMILYGSVNLLCKYVLHL